MIPPTTAILHIPYFSCLKHSFCIILSIQDINEGKLAAHDLSGMFGNEENEERGSALRTGYSSKGASFSMGKLLTLPVDRIDR